MSDLTPTACPAHQIVSPIFVPNVVTTRQLALDPNYVPNVCRISSSVTSRHLVLETTCVSNAVVPTSVTISQGNCVTIRHFVLHPIFIPFVSSVVPMFVHVTLFNLLSLVNPLDIEILPPCVGLDVLCVLVVVFSFSFAFVLAFVIARLAFALAFVLLAFAFARAWLAFAFVVRARPSTCLIAFAGVRQVRTMSSFLGTSDLGCPSPTNPSASCVFLRVNSTFSISFTICVHSVVPAVLITR